MLVLSLRGEEYECGNRKGNLGKVKCSESMGRTGVHSYTQCRSLKKGSFFRCLMRLTKSRTSPARRLACVGRID